MDKTRTQKGLRNVICSLLVYSGLIVFEFINRTVFVQMLSAEYLGLNGLFKNILSFLAMAELGIGSAISFALYKPVSEGNIEVIKSIMDLYKRLYRIVGTAVLCLGGILTPFLPYLIKDVPADMPYIYSYYLLYVVNSGISYFFTYKRTIIICDQDQYISSLTSTGSKIILSIVQIIILIMTHNYILYLLAMAVITVSENLLISHIADKKYPYLKDKQTAGLDEGDKLSIKKNVYAMMFHGIGGTIVDSSDNLIISKIIGLVTVGLYSNYTLIINALSNLLVQIFHALTAGVGNLSVTESDRHAEHVFYRILFANFWIFGFCTVCLICLLEPLVAIWLGEEYLLGITTVVVISIKFYINGMLRTVRMFKDASGLFWQDRYKSLAECTVNIAASIPLAICFGVKGVLIGTIIAKMLVPFGIEGYVLFRNAFHSRMGKYYLLQIQYGLSTSLAAAATYGCIRFLPDQGIGGFLLKAMVGICVPNIIFFLLYCNNESFRYYAGIMKRIFGKKREYGLKR